VAIVIPYSKQVWVDGNLTYPASAARFLVMEEGILDVSQAPAVRVYHNTTQSINSGATTALAFNSERFDQAGGAASTMHDNSTNNSRLTCLYAGIYLITASAQWASSPNPANIYIRLNNTTDVAQSGLAADYRTMSVSTIYNLAVNDYVECRVSQSSGGAINILSTGNLSPEFMMVRVA